MASHPPSGRSWKREGWPWPDAAPRRRVLSLEKDGSTLAGLQADVASAAEELLRLADQTLRAAARLDDARGELALATDAASLETALAAIEQAGRSSE